MRQKTIIPWMSNNPHYWLQYGMARLTYKELDLAERYFKTARSHSERMPGYDTTYLDNQYARLLLLKSIESKDTPEGFQYFSDAHRILKRQESDVYKFRQVKKYRDVYDACFVYMSAKNRVDFEHSCRFMLNILEREIPHFALDASANDLYLCQHALNYIVKDILIHRAN